MQQLRQGVVTVPAADVARALPASIAADVSAAGEGLIRLDLKEAVAAVGLDALRVATPAATRTYDIGWMADPFAEPAEKPDLQAVRSVKKEKKQAKEVAAKPLHREPQAASKITVYKPAADAESELDYYELPGNININAASEDELTILSGVGRHLARAIVECREKRGQFNSVFDLFKVEGVDEVRFRQMTGMKSSQKRRHRRKRLASLLKIPAASVADLHAVAEAVARKQGFNGCMISDGDGLVLAQSGFGAVGDNLAAILPGTLGHIAHSMDLAGLKVTGTLSISVGGDLYTVQGAENVILSARHAENMVSESDLSFMRKVGRELAWLLSVRAYAGPKP
jgi:competence ComEA-like helix-hairpin-helix protein